MSGLKFTFSGIMSLLPDNLSTLKKIIFRPDQREELWFASMLKDQNIDQHWKSDFRMSQDTFWDIVRVVQPVQEKRNTQSWHAIPVKQWVTFGLWRLLTGNSFRTVVKIYSVGKSTVIQITVEFCSEMLCLAPRYIHFPR